MNNREVFHPAEKNFRCQTEKLLIRNVFLPQKAERQKEGKEGKKDNSIKNILRGFEKNSLN
jgi:hypothetical protein